MRGNRRAATVHAGGAELTGELTSPSVPLFVLDIDNYYESMEFSDKSSG